MANRAIWSMRKRHEWLTTPLKKKRVKRATRVRCGLQDAMADDVGYQAWLPNDPSAPGCLATPDIWSQAVEEMAGLAYPGAVYAVVGSKKVGKSTLGRLLVNELLFGAPERYLDRYRSCQAN